MYVLRRFMPAAVLLAGLFSSLSAQTLTPVAFLDGAASEFPEAIAVDARNNCYMSLVFGGRVKKVTPGGTATDFASVPDGWLLGMAFDRAGNLMLCGASGIWKIDASGTASLFAAIPGHAFLNDLVYDHCGNLYVTDSNLPGIWRVDARGNATLWCSDPLLQGVADGLFPFPLGPNGIRFDRDRKTLQVVNTSRGAVLQIDVRRDGTAGPARVLAEAPELIGADGIEVDDHDNVYVTVNIQDRIARVSPRGEISDVVVDDILATPTAIAFLHGGAGRSLYVCNNGNVFFSATPLGEGLLRLELDRVGCHRGRDHNRR